MLYSLFGKILLVLVIIGGLNWGVYGIWGLNAVGWLLGGSLGWLARAVFIAVGLAALVLIPALLPAAPIGTPRNAAPDPAASPQRTRAHCRCLFCSAPLLFFPAWPAYFRMSRSRSRAWSSSWPASRGTRVRS